jgi:hypothetical protein
MRRSEMPASAASAMARKSSWKRQRLAVKIAAGEDLVAEHHGLSVAEFSSMAKTRRASASASSTAP